MAKNCKRVSFMMLALIAVIVGASWRVQATHTLHGAQQKEPVTQQELFEDGDVTLIDTDSKSIKKQKKIKRQLALAQMLSSGTVSDRAEQSESEQSVSTELLDVKDDANLQVPLDFQNEALYVGTIYLGTPQSQPARVVFDTGSEYLAVTSALCDDTAAQNYKFKVYDAGANDFVSKNVENRCPTMSYDMHKSQTSKILSRSSSKLAYGSAKLQGFVWEDTACLQQVSSGQNGTMSAAQMKQEKCTPFQFLALYKAEGCEEGTDGILGLSPHKNDEKRNMHYLWALKDSGIIDRAIVSFNLATKDIDDQSYALFGGVNSTQIVNGVQGLRTFQSFPNWLGTWALEGQKVMYGDKLLPNTQGSYPAIIDTGTSQMQVPPRVFSEIFKEWDEMLSKVQPRISCPENEAFCTSDLSCNEIATKVQPVGLVLSGTTFVLPPKEYLYQVDGGKCYFILSECKLGGKNKDIYILGAAFLKHFYSAFDFDKNTISLGINAHATGEVKMVEGPKSE